MFYALVLLSCAAFVAHLVLLDRLQRFRIRPVSWQGWFKGWRTDDGRNFGFYSPGNYSAQGRRLLAWVYSAGIVWLLLVVLAARTLQATLR